MDIIASGVIPIRNITITITNITVIRFRLLNFLLALVFRRSLIIHISSTINTTGKQRQKIKPCVTPEILDLCDQRRDLKKKRGEPEGAKDYREIKRKIRTDMKMAKETWIQGQCQEVEACLGKNNNNKAYQLVKDRKKEKQGKTTTIQDKSGKCLTEENEILNRWTEYCSDLYNYETEGAQ